MANQQDSIGKHVSNTLEIPLAHFQSIANIRANARLSVSTRVDGAPEVFDVYLTRGGVGEDSMAISGGVLR